MIRLRLAAACTFFAALATAPAALAAPGSLDPTFGSGGIAATVLGSDDYVRDIALQPDGKTVAAGTAWDGTRYRFALARYDVDGSLDPAFGTAGKVLTGIGSSSVAQAVALQPDGKIVAAGTGSGDFAVARYNADGSLDSSFSADGMATAAVGNEATAWDLAIQPDGRIVLAGQAKVSGAQRFALARFTGAGDLDTSFGTRGKTTTPLGTDGAVAMALVRQADGRLVAAGSASESGGARFALARYSAGGSLDTSFGSGGSVLTTVGGGGQATGLIADPAGRLVAVGGAVDGFVYKAALTRYSADGALDSSFGTRGVAFAHAGQMATIASGVARQQDGRLVVVGESIGASGSTFAVSRFEADGALDSTFGSGGSVTTAIGQRSGAYDVAVQADGQILAAGAGNGNADGSARQFALARYTAAGDEGTGGSGGSTGGTGDGGSGGSTGDGSTGTGDGSTGTGDGSTGTGDGSTGTGDGSTGTGDGGSGGSTGDTGGSTGTGDGSTGTGDGSTGSTGDTTGSTGSTGGGVPIPTPEPGGGLAGQIVPGGLELIPANVRPIVLPPQPLKLQNTGIVPVRVRCIEIPAGSCRGTILITVPEQVVLPYVRHRRVGPAASRRVTVGRASVRIPSGGTATARPRLTGPAARALRRRGSLRVVVTATMTVNGTARISTRTLTLR
jgi:uncharacterized delta-60 repeat protein